MQHFDYKPHGVCPMRISFDLEGDTVHNVSFTGGCNGNLQAISRVVEGMTVDQIEGYFRGISCNGRGTRAARISSRRAFDRRLRAQNKP